MENAIERYLVNIPIIRKQYDKTKSAKFKGTLSIISNKHGIIFDWQINFSEVYIDTYTTVSWFKQKKHVNFQRRKKLFEVLNLEMKKRPSHSSNELVKLNPNQLRELNKFFNDRDQYDSSIKNIVGLLKGNNACGEAKKPKQAEMVIDNDSNIKNFVILIDDLVMKKKVKFSCFWNIKEIKLEEYVHLNPRIEKAFNYMQEDKKLADWQAYLDQIKAYCREFNCDIEKAENIVKKAKSNYQISIDNEIKQFPFGFTSKDEFEKCHIYEVHSLRDQIVEALRDNRSPEKWVKMISDPENFIPLPGEIHRKFDSNYFTYDQNGNIHILDEKRDEFAKKYLKKFSNIDKWFLTPKKVEYIELRNNELGL